MKKRFAFLVKPWFMGVLFVVWAFAMAMATFIENDFGAVTSKKVIYNTKWFELIILLLAINLIGQIISYKLYKKKKFTVFLFHTAFLVIILGAAITRYFGFEGVIHIREGESQNICQTTDKYISVSIDNNEGKELYHDSRKFIATSLSSDKYSAKTSIDDIDYKIKFLNYLPNAAEQIINTPNGKPIVLLTASRAMMGQHNITLSEGDIQNLMGTEFSFSQSDSADIQILYDGETFKISSIAEISEMSMMTRESISFPPSTPIPFETMKIYEIKGWRIVAQQISHSGIKGPVSVDYKTEQTGQSALEFELTYGNESTNLYVWAKGKNTKPAIFNHDKHKISIAYSTKSFELPFEIKLNDFIFERYPGSNSPSSYKSDVVLIDKENNIEEPYLIYMNNILKYKGYRFYQSFYDQDEKGTILSVNHDNAGMIITYIGYAIMIVFILLSLINKATTYRKVTEKFWSKTTKTVIILLLIFASPKAFANQNLTFLSKEKAEEFGQLLVQDNQGRTKPLFTQSNDILRKVYRKTEFEGFSSMQVYLGLYYEFNYWKDVQIIKVSNSEIKNIIGIRGDYASFSDIVDLQSNQYKIGQYLDGAYNKPPGARSKFDKEIIKVDERVNILYMASQGQFMKIFPLSDGTDKWGTHLQALKNAESEMDSLYLQNILQLYYGALQNGNATGDFKVADEYLNSISNYQIKFANYNLPAQSKIKAEIFYYKSEIFERLFPFYALLGISLLVILLAKIIAGNEKMQLAIRILNVILLIGFAFHTFGLGLRWYISGHAPMSNGYESMIFISWVTVLAGFLFIKKSSFSTSATAVLASLTLMVAHLSFMDPVITNLVPVLQSYWLTLHVSIITGSYGFLGLGAILGLIVLLLYSFLKGDNKQRIDTAIKELTVLNYKTLTVGLYLLTIGTFLGAIWANESWGRYWGWDPKETWSLITIIVYSFVIHSRMISSFKNVYTFNVMSLFAFSSVLMTYFGVNYYLSGLHSYAGGDPVPVPKFVYFTVVSVIALAIFAHRKYIKELK